MGVPIHLEVPIHLGAPIHLERLLEVAERITQQLDTALPESGVKRPRLAGKRSRTVSEMTEAGWKGVVKSNQQRTRAFVTRTQLKV